MKTSYNIMSFMMRSVILILVNVCVHFSILGNNENRDINFRLPNDSIFYLGIDYYNKGDYNNAIPCFETIHNDSTYLKNRYQMIIYADMWLGNIYVKQNNAALALNYSPYTSQYCFSLPLDPRDMEDVDSLTFEGVRCHNTDILKCIEIFKKRNDILTHKIGANHLWTDGGRQILIQLYQEYRKNLHQEYQDRLKYDLYASFDSDIEIQIANTIGGFYQFHFLFLA